MAEQFGRRQARLALAIGMALVVAGCIPRARPRAPAPPPPPIDVPEPEPTPNLPPDETRNRVAVLVPLSGENGGVGTSIANAANLALLDAGGEGIRITVYDTAKGGAAAAANEALADGNGLFLGPLLADDARAVAPIARRARVPVVTFSNDVAVAGDGVYVMGFSPAQSVDRVVRHARSEGVQRFAGLIPAGTYGRHASSALMKSVEGAGGRLVALQEFDRSPQGLRLAITRLGAQSPYDAVLIADTGRIGMQAAPLIRASATGRSARLLGTELWKTESGLATQPALRGAWFATVPDAMFNQLRTRYRARYGKTPYRLASLGYDSVLLAVRAARDWPFRRSFPESALRNPEGFMGVDGAFRFGRDGIAERALEVVQVNAGGLATVSPAPKGF